MGTNVPARPGPEISASGALVPKEVVATEEDSGSRMIEIDFEAKIPLALFKRNNYNIVADVMSLHSSVSF
ncbi:hypothetical protein [Cohnella sp. JJ-181]|uniref:hypothetical protein n=1 Tax=Cohnella rhizoplanae TaxID=2974897 RepID=UPI00232CDFE2|nr:hypothetical protein [Cohnella sp. JJ-181]